MTILELELGSFARILEIGDSVYQDRLFSFGLFPGSKIRLIKKAPFGGPVMIEEVTTKMRLIIGKELASCIDVLHCATV